jgi:hypothetical protein
MHCRVCSQICIQVYTTFRSGHQVFAFRTREAPSSESQEVSWFLHNFNKNWGKSINLWGIYLYLMLIIRLYNVVKYRCLWVIRNRSTQLTVVYRCLQGIYPYLTGLINQETSLGMYQLHSCKEHPCLGLILLEV